MKLLGTLATSAFLIFAVSNASSVSRLALAYGSASSTITVQGQPQSQQPEGPKHCERPSKKNPNVGEKDPDKVGCMCVYRCVNGKPQEDNSDPETKCKNYCKKDQCDCKKPSCKS